MGDHVTFITVLPPSPYSVATHALLHRSAFTGFPFGVGYHDDTLPLAGPFTLAQCIRNYWRLKKWAISGGLVMQFLNAGVSYTATATFSGTITMDGPPAFPNTRERDLIRGYYLTGTFAGSYSCPFYDGGATATGDCELTFNLFDSVFSPTAGRLQRDTPTNPEDYYIGLGMSFEFVGLEYYTAIGPVFGPLIAEANAAGAQSATIDGQPAFLEASYIPLSTITSCTVAIVPATVAGSYWEYAKPDGSPLYDDATGARL